MSTYPTIDLNDGNRIPQLGFGVFQIAPDETAGAVQARRSTSATATSTPPRCTSNEKGVGEGIRDAGVDRAEVFVTSKLNNGFHEPDDARRAFDADPRRAGLRLRRPVPDPLAAADALRRRLRLDLEDAGGVPEGRPRPQHRRVQLPGRTTSSGSPRRPRRCPRSTRSRCTRTSPTTRCARTASEHGIATEAWSPIAQGEVLDDPVVDADRRGDRQDAGPGGAALAHPARRHRLPEVGDAAAHQGELRHLRLRARASDDVDAITGLDKGEAGRTGPNPDTFDYDPEAEPPSVRQTAGRRDRRSPRSRRSLASGSQLARAATLLGAAAACRDRGDAPT